MRKSEFLSTDLSPDFEFRSAACKTAGDSVVIREIVDATDISKGIRRPTALTRESRDIFALRVQHINLLLHGRRGLGVPAFFAKANFPTNISGGRKSGGRASPLISREGRWESFPRELVGCARVF